MTALRSRRAAPDASRHNLAVYDGRTLLGHVREEGGRCLATTADGRDLGEFPNRKSAVNAIGEAARQRGRGLP